MRSSFRLIKTFAGWHNVEGLAPQPCKHTGLYMLVPESWVYWKPIVCFCSRPHSSLRTIPVWGFVGLGLRRHVYCKLRLLCFLPLRLFHMISPMEMVFSCQRRLICVSFRMAWRFWARFRTTWPVGLIILVPSQLFVRRSLAHASLCRVTSWAKGYLVLLWTRRCVIAELVANWRGDGLGRQTCKQT